ncbi:MULTISPECIES: response regulator [Flavobacteriaceae]|uniref:response regulator n=1 Tax=Flavobacteriaceae TaxID=49546 RepID=UPI00149103C6|nr:MULTISPECIES: response regulator [Allomuricauda]MDC6366216.1 response regulator [Muricauda sp. AC10]
MKLTVCIIDDDLVSQFATRYCIQQSHAEFDIVTCSSGEEGLSTCFDMFENDGKLPDIIFLDLVMDGMDGWTFLENLRNLFKRDKLPRVYILSAFVNTKDRTIAKEHKLISGYVDKPLSRNYLEKILQHEKTASR